MQSSILVPTVIEQTHQGERVYDIYSRLLKERIVFLGTDVNPTTASLITAQLLYLQSVDAKKDIYMYINSPGGSVYDLLSIYDAMQYVKPDIQTICTGLAASAAAVILAAGAKGKRFALPHSKIMIHQPRGGGGHGTVTDREIDLKESLSLKKTLNEILAFHTGQKEEKIHVDMERDFYMNAEEAKAYGIIDDIIS